METAEAESEVKMKIAEKGRRRAEVPRGPLRWGSSEMGGRRGAPKAASEGPAQSLPASRELWKSQRWV